jgi:serine/threonine protein kinase
VTVADGHWLPELSRGDVIAGTFEIEQKLGSGMLGATYLARHLKTRQAVALKLIKPSLLASGKDLERFERAFKAVQKTRHDGLVRYFEMGQHEGVTWFSMEYFESQNLRTVMNEYQKEQKPFTIQEACQIVIRILEATDSIHKQGIIHKNIKPENVLVQTKRIGPGGGKIVRTIKITDAGLAEIVNPSIFAEGYIARDEMPYMAPELTAFSEPGSPPSDIYSVGVLLYELLVGQTPRGTYLAPTQLRGDLPDHIDDIVEVAMDADSHGRYPTCQDMLNDIQSSFSGDIFEKQAPISFRNVLVGVGVVIAILIGYTIYITNFQAKVDPMDEARVHDEQVRRELANTNPPPDQATIDTMTAPHREMLYIPTGTFAMGRLYQEGLATAFQSEPLAQIEKVSAFYIDRFEFPNTLKDFEGNPAKPAAKVTWKQADEACAQLGKRLCSEQEWEKACKGPANWIYSYGDTFDHEMCGGGINDPYHLGERESCVSGYGVYDLSGGLREWTATLHGPKKNRAVVKGGLKTNNERGSRCAFSVDESTTYADGTLAFRCCLDVGVAKEPATGEAQAAQPQ